MFRKSMIALAAIAALPPPPSSQPTLPPSRRRLEGRRLRQGRQLHHGYRHFGAAYGFYGLGAMSPTATQIVTRRGFLRTVCERD